MRRSIPYAIILVIGSAILVPAIIARPMVHDSFWIDWVWADQFTAAVRSGILYPRWLPLSYGGLGAPVFYFYPPGAFWLTALFGLLGASTYASMLLAFGTASVCSGIAMFLWLKGWTGRPLLGALFYMVAPYHICDFYYRGALAESCAYAVLPLVALGLRRCASSGDMRLLALSYAALILCHLPIALLTSLFLIAPLMLWLGWKRKAAKLARVALGLLLGAGIAAIYLVPALTLQDHVALGKLWALPAFQPTHWNLFAADTWAHQKKAGLLFAVVASLVIGAAGLCRFARSRGWSGYALLLCLIASGAIPFMWGLPLVDHVQFPWRSLVLAELGLATALALATGAPARNLLYLLPALFVATMFLAPIQSTAEDPIGYLHRHHPDTLEYLPPGLTASTDFNGALHATRQQRAMPLLTVSGDTFIVRRFYFPAWRVTCAGDKAVSTFPDPATKLLSFRGRGCAVRLSWTRAEYVGGAISLLSVLLLLAVAHRRRSGQPSGDASRKT